MTREVTLAATQFACGWDIPANLDTAERLVREAAGRGAQIVLLSGAVRDAVLPHHAGHAALRPGRAGGGPPGHRPVQPAGRRARGRAPGELLRARRPGVLQLGGDRRRRRRLPRRLPQEPHPRLRRLPGEVLLLARRHRLPRLGHRLRAHRRRHLLGPVVPGVRPRAWRCRAPRCCCIPRPSAATRRRRTTTRATCGSSCSAATPSPTRCRWWRPTGSAWRRRPAASRASASTARRSSPSETGALLAEASRDREEVVTATVDLDAVRYQREDWRFFRDRRPELYGPLLTLDGEDRAAGISVRRAAGCAARRSRGA